jgi:hypothetical protein
MMDGFVVKKHYNKNTNEFRALISDSNLPCDVRGNWLRNSISMLTKHLNDINLILEMISDLYPEYEFCLYYQSFDESSLESIMIFGFNEVDEKFRISWNSDISKISIILFKPEDDITEITNITIKLTLCIKCYDDDDNDDYDDYDMYMEQCDSDLAKRFAENIKKKFIEGVRFSFKFPIHKPIDDDTDEEDN